MIRQSFKMALNSILSNKMRSALTMLGIIIGVFALVVLVSLVQGATGTVTESINSLGNNLLMVSIQDDKGAPIKVDALDEFVRNPQIKDVAPVGQTVTTVSNAYAEERVSITGTNAGYFSIQNLPLESGRYLRTADVDNNTYVVVVNNRLALDFFGRTDVVGETIQLAGTQFTIAGVLEAKEDNGYAMMMGNLYQAYIPYTTLIRISNSVSTSVRQFYVTATDESTLSDVEDGLNQKLLARFHRDEDAYTVFNQSAIVSVMDNVMGTMSLLLGTIAGISLLVGGIGIMNIMLVSVTERTREIGIRKAIGATRRTILMQFLLEAMVLSLFGCIIGILFSGLAMEIINRFGDVSYGLSPSVVTVAVVFSTVIGVLFGLYPANRAASMKPIDALRYNG